MDEQTSQDWAVTFTYDATPDEQTLRRVEDTLTHLGADASVSSTRRRPPASPGCTSSPGRVAPALPVGRAGMFGSLVGGLLQSVTFVIGIKALLLLVAVFYLAAILTRPRGAKAAGTALAPA